jgi:hypothetical protein
MLESDRERRAAFTTDEESQLRRQNESQLLDGGVSASTTLHSVPFSSLRTFRPLCKSTRQFRRNAPATWHAFRSKQRSTCDLSIVEVSLCSQMLYPVELRAPVKSGNLRVQCNRVNQQQTERTPNTQRRMPNLEFGWRVRRWTLSVGRFPCFIFE